MVNWRNYIVVGDKTLSQKPMVKGTGLLVEDILEKFASGWREEQILSLFPALSTDALQAVFSYAYDTMKNGPYSNEQVLQNEIEFSFAFA